MIPVVTAVRLTGARNRAELPLLVLGPALGTSATGLWRDCATHLGDAFDVLAWDLPGHGHNRAVPDEQFSMSELAAGVLRVVDDVLAERGEVGMPFYYAGDSVGGAVGLQLLLDAPDRVTSAVLLGQPTGGARRPGRETDDDGYVQVCAVLSDFDVRDRLAEIHAPVLAVAGAADVASPTDMLREIAEGVARGRLVELEGAAHLAPVQAPETVAGLLREHLLGEVVPDTGGGQRAELAQHLRDARANGLSGEEITEVLRQVLAEESSGEV